MGDQHPFIVAPDADRYAIGIAVRVAEDEVLRGLARFMERDGNDHSEYVVTGYEELKRLIPGLDDGRWREVTGSEPPGACQYTPYSCCGYCDECDDHHEVDEKYEVCDKGHCHSCDHVCDR